MVSMFLLAAILVAGTISMTIPKSFALDFGNSFGNDHNKYSKSANIQEIKCVNVNVNINGVDFKNHTKLMGTEPVTGAALQGDGATAGGNGLFGDGGINIDKNLVNICVNFNYNEQEDDGFKKPNHGPHR